MKHGPHRMHKHRKTNYDASGSYFPKLITTTRQALGESQEEFGRRFDTHPNTVSRWESGQYEAPYKVVEFLLHMQKHEFVCPLCKGEGTLRTYINKPNPAFEPTADRRGRAVRSKRNVRHERRTREDDEMTNIRKHMDLLGLRVQDRVTGLKGVVASISFDLYGCVQAIVNPGMDKDGKLKDQIWFDVGRLKVLNKEPVMKLPDYDYGPQAEGRQGPAERPAFCKA